MINSHRERETVGLLALNGTAVPHALLLWPRYYCKGGGGKVFRRQTWAKSTRKQCLPHTAGQLQGGTHGACDSIHKSCASLVQRVSWQGEGRGHEVPFLDKGPLVPDDS